MQLLFVVNQNFVNYCKLSFTVNENSIYRK